MNKNKKVVPIGHAFGLGFGLWLDALEKWEDTFKHNAKNAGRGVNKNYKKHEPLTNFLVNSTLFPEFANKSVLPNDSSPFTFKTIENDFEVTTALDKWASIVKFLRSSFKFKLNKEQVLKKITQVYESTGPTEFYTYLPYENVFIQYERDDDEFHFLMLCRRVKAKKDKPKINVKSGEFYICINMVEYKKGNLASDTVLKDIEDKPKNIKKMFHNNVLHYPLELHIPEGRVFFAVPRKESRGGIRVIISQHRNQDMKQEEIEKIKDLEETGFGSFLEIVPYGGVSLKTFNEDKYVHWFVGAFLGFIFMLSCGGVIQTTRGKLKPQDVYRRKPKHKKNHPMYEYRILEIGDDHQEPLVNYVVPRATTKKRLHSVMGHYRRYKKPLKSGPNAGKTVVLVEGHWRGDKNLGVVKKDYAFVNQRAEDETG